MLRHDSACDGLVGRSQTPAPPIAGTPVLIGYPPRRKRLSLLLARTVPEHSACKKPGRLVGMLANVAAHSGRGGGRADLPGGGGKSLPSGGVRARGGV